MTAIVHPKPCSTQAAAGLSIPLTGSARRTTALWRACGLSLLGLAALSPAWADGDRRAPPLLLPKAYTSECAACPLAAFLGTPHP